MRKKWPCIENGVACELRQPGCQSKCLKMLVAQLELDTVKTVERKNKDIDVAYAQVRMSCTTAKKRKKRK